MSENRVIGNAGRIPWHLPEDFRWFKEVTMRGVLVMGRKTFQSIGRPLPGRETVVLTRGDFSHPGVRTFVDVDKLRTDLRDDPRPVWICGGSEIYGILLGDCSDLFLSRVHQSADGDATFPSFETEFSQVAEVLRTPRFHVEHWAHRSTLLA